MCDSTHESNYSSDRFRAYPVWRASRPGESDAGAHESYPGVIGEMTTGRRHRLRNHYERSVTEIQNSHWRPLIQRNRPSSPRSEGNYTAIVRGVNSTTGNASWKFTICSIAATDSRGKRITFVKCTILKRLTNRLTTRRAAAKSRFAFSCHARPLPFRPLS